MADALQTFDFQAFLNGDCQNPGDHFGMRPAPSGLFVRAFMPLAKVVEVVKSATGEVVAELRMTHPEGIFEGLLPRLKKPSGRWPVAFRVASMQRSRSRRSVAASS